MPERIQYKRGQKLPEGAKLCARPSRWGNPFKIGSLYLKPDQPMRVPPLPDAADAAEGIGVIREISDVKWVYTACRVRDRAHATALFIAWADFVFFDGSALSFREQVRRDLDGFDLACYCPVDGEPCHADALLRWAAGFRAWTPDLADGHSRRTVRVKRACNGCGELIGDITGYEITAAMNGGALPDVRAECPRCSRGLR
ncbi:MAG TPA: DUF4326 domain-containing protein [Streptosporangiaceae bacterium]|nr:DUF4326 domain-containing protein [Streptosporangiaceae bacterium]